MQHTSFLLRNLINSVGGILKYRICHVSAQSLRLGKPQRSEQTWAARLQEFRPMARRYWTQGPKASFHYLLLGEGSTSVPSKSCFSCRQDFSEAPVSTDSRSFAAPLQEIPQLGRQGLVLCCLQQQEQQRPNCCFSAQDFYYIYTRPSHFVSKIFHRWRIHCSLEGFFPSSQILSLGLWSVGCGTWLYPLTERQHIAELGTPWLKDLWAEISGG